MKVWSVTGLLFTAAIIAIIPVSPQVTPRGVELSVDQAQAITYGRHRRVTRRAYRRGTTVLPSRSAVAAANGTRGSFYAVSRRTLASRIKSASARLRSELWAYVL